MPNSERRRPLIGCNGRGAQRSGPQRPVGLEELPIREQFRLVAESGVFDYFDRLPLRSNLDDYLAAMREFDLPVHTGSWFYRLGADDALLRDNLKICKEVGAACHNIMTFTQHADGHRLGDEEIVAHYLEVYDEGMKLGVAPAFELHVNMWTEEFLRVEAVADAVQRRGVPFNFTLDYSHVNFKIGNPQELERSGVRAQVESGALILDPFEKGSLCERWLGRNIVTWAQLRSAAPSQPMNLWWKDAQGEFGRGIQYPFVKPAPGQWHSAWSAYLLEPSKEAIRKVLRHHLRNPASPLKYLTTEMINLPDYGLNARYDLFEKNVAAARFIRSAWDEAVALDEAGML